MKRILIIIIVFIIACLFAFLYFNQIQETNRVKANYDIEYKHELDKQQQLTYKELKKYYQNEIGLLKKQNIKPRQIKNIIKIRYNYKDTLIPKDTLIYKDSIVLDTIFQSTTFDVESGCTRVVGRIANNTIYFDYVNSNDTLLISLYKEKRKCLFEKRGIKAIAISQCKGDTLSVLRNLRVRK